MCRFQLIQTYCVSAQDRTMAMTSLLSLDLSSNYLTEVFSLHTAPNIDTLNMTHNRISRITGKFQQKIQIHLSGYICCKILLESIKEN